VLFGACYKDLEGQHGRPSLRVPVDNIYLSPLFSPFFFSLSPLVPLFAFRVLAVKEADPAAAFRPPFFFSRSCHGGL